MGDKLNDEVLEALERIEEYVEGWQTFDERGPERRFVLDRFPCIVVYVVPDTEIPDHRRRVRRARAGLLAQAAVDAVPRAGARAAQP